MKEILISLYNYIPGYKKTTQYIMKDENKKFLVFSQESLQQSSQISFCLNDKKDKLKNNNNMINNNILNFDRTNKSNNNNYNSFKSTSSLGRKTIRNCFTLTGKGYKNKDYFTSFDLTKHFSFSLLEEVTKLNKNIENLQNLIISMKK